MRMSETLQSSPSYVWKSRHSFFAITLQSQQADVLVAGSPAGHFLLAPSFYLLKDTTEMRLPPAQQLATCKLQEKQFTKF
jgi:hypothetical protein